MYRSLSLLLGIMTLAGCASFLGSHTKEQPGASSTASLPSLTDLFSSGPKLLGTRWVWVETTTPSSRVVAPSSGMYLLDFGTEGFIRLTADCNRGSAKYTLDGKDFKAGQAALTRASCPPGGQGNRFTADLGKTERAEISDGELLLSMPANTGVMRFAPLKSNRYLCANKLKFGLVDLPGKDVAIEFDGRFFRAVQVTTASGVAYEGERVRFQSKGDDAMLDLGEQALRNCKVQKAKT
ncbi:META domain-containing protein [Chitinimonas sp. PSY-7]|uniref:META domain-containing protein n=1 Tax=Chitinimonas sp. PSY-7 TaxID=3459088 RepID=UPI00403FCE5A